MQGVLSLAQIRLAARQESDMERSQSVSDSELNFYVNQSCFELWDLLTKRYGDDYKISPNIYAINTDGQSEFYNLPPDFYKLAGVDLALTPLGLPGQRITIFPFNFSERNDFVIPNMPIAPVVSFGAGVRYRLHENRIWLLPIIQSGILCRLHYHPRFLELADFATINMNGTAVGDTITINGATYTAGTDFNVEGSDFATAQNLAALLNINAATLKILNANAYLNPPGYGGNVVIQIQIFNSSITCSTTGGNMVFGILLPIAPVASQLVLQPRTVVSDTFDAISGWLEYVILDAGIKMLQKEESDASVLLARKQIIQAHIQTMSTNRDSGQPKRVSRTRNSGWGWPRQASGFPGWGY